MGSCEHSFLNRSTFKRGKPVEIPKYSEKELKHIDELKNHKIHTFFNDDDLKQFKVKLLMILFDDSFDFNFLVTKLSFTKLELSLLLDYLILDNLVDIEDSFYLLTKTGRLQCSKD